MKKININSALKMKNKEKQIIKLMRTGKRLNISDIARQLNLPISTVSDAIRRIEKKYTVKRTSVLDYAKMGYYANAKLAIKIDSKQKIDFIEFLKQFDCVNTIYHINSGYDLLIEVIFKDISELKEWVSDAKERFEFEETVFQILKIEQKERFVPS